MTADRITVVIPTRNRCRLLRQTLGTVFAQEGAEVDVVVVDEGSTDETPGMLARLRSDRLTVLRHEQAKGVSAARNAGIAAATGTWVAFVDDDDLWAPGKLGAQIAAARSGKGAGWTCAGAVRLNTRLQVRGAERPPVVSTVADKLLAHNVIPGGASGVMARTDLVREVGGFDEAISSLADYDLWIRLGLAAPLAVADRPLVGYRIHPAGMAHNVGRSEQELAYVEKKYQQVRSTRGIAIQKDMFLWLFGALYLRQGQRLQAMRVHRDIALRYRKRPAHALSLALLSPIGPALQQVRDRSRNRRVPAPWRAEAEQWLAPLREC